MSVVIRAVIVSVVIWVLMSLAIDRAASSYLVPHDLRQLAERGHRTQGKVVAKDGTDQRVIEYQYSFAGTVYFDSRSSYFPNPVSKELRPGSIVTVTYDPIEPSNSLLGYAQDEIRSIERLSRVAAVVAPFFPVSMFLLFYLGIAFARRSSQRQTSTRDDSIA